MNKKKKASVQLGSNFKTTTKKIFITALGSNVVIKKYDLYSLTVCIMILCGLDLDIIYN